MMPQRVKFDTDAIELFRSGLASTLMNGGDARANEEFVCAVTVLSEDGKKQPEESCPVVAKIASRCSVMVPGGKMFSKSTLMS